MTHRDAFLKGSRPRKRTTLGHASAQQKAKVAREGARIAAPSSGPVDPAHITPRTQGGCDHEDCVCGLPRRLHERYDEGKLDILPYLTRAEQAHAAGHLGLLGALRRTTGEDYVPEPRFSRPTTWVEITDPR